MQWSNSKYAWTRCCEVNHCNGFESKYLKLDRCPYNTFLADCPLNFNSYKLFQFNCIESVQVKHFNLKLNLPNKGNCVAVATEWISVISRHDKTAFLRFPQNWLFKLKFRCVRWSCRAEPFLQFCRANLSQFFFTSNAQTDYFRFLLVFHDLRVTRKRFAIS